MLVFSHCVSVSVSVIVSISDSVSVNVSILLVSVLVLVLVYPASSLLRLEKETLFAACTFHIEHAPNSNVTDPWVASLSK